MTTSTSFDKWMSEKFKDDGECAICGEMTKSWHGNSSLWAVQLPCPPKNEPGKIFPHHVGCVVKKLYFEQ